LDGVSFNLAEQLRDLLAEEINALDPISAPDESHGPGPHR
jgi:hypothetical protein